jgi:ribosomal protein L32
MRDFFMASYGIQYTMHVKCKNCGFVRIVNELCEYSGKNLTPEKDAFYLDKITFCYEL